ncbi:fatty acyl-CoA reductase wat-like [Tribolium madens]|uniref:fatty acyl-CoA reductase wat-like n=1 Tax=Tribolium madens TaxID=41895 RepID=UPI001CF74079|nr:fatty acyl-CoA reductase wat-like [Tribolium madens]
MTSSEINEFFKNQTVFLLGGTGFLGKFLIDKLLRLNEISKIYILVRPKKGKSVDERFCDLFDFPCFERLKKENPGFRKKIVFVSGDCEQPNLGISQETEDVLIAETSIVIHAAANVKFDQPLRIATYINVRSTQDCIHLAKKMPNLKAFIYVSTAYSNFPYFDIDETLYEPAMRSKNLLSVVDSLDDETLNKVTPGLLGKWPNAYVFTKTIAENLMKSEENNLPIAIVRPAIVMSAAEEPMPGWVDNFNGVTGVTTAVSVGVIRSFCCQKNATAHLVPCDYVCNIILASAWHVGQQKSSTLTIYNFIGSNTNAVSWQKFKDLFEICIKNYPTTKSMWYYGLAVTHYKFYHDLKTFLFHTVLCSLVDFILLCGGKKPVVVQNMRRFDYAINLMTSFTTSSFNFKHDNVDNLWKQMNDQDKNLYRFDMSTFDWRTYIRSYVIGARVYLLKDPLETIPEGHKKVQFLAVAYYFTMGVLFCLIYFFIKFVLKLVL